MFYTCDFHQHVNVSSFSQNEKKIIKVIFFYIQVLGYQRKQNERENKVQSRKRKAHSANEMKAAFQHGN